MSARPLVSVVVVNHNYERFLGAAIESALGQSYGRCEVVVVDDGSTDSSAGVIKRYGRRVVPLTRANGGQTDAMNAGFAAASGELVCFLDADDLIGRDALEAAVPLFADPLVVKVHWPLDEIDASGARTGRIWPREALPEGDLRGALVELGPAQLPFPPQSGNLFSRRLLESVLPLPSLECEFGVGSASADLYLSMVAAAEGRIGALPRALGCYRVHGANDFAGEGIDRHVARSVAIADRHLLRLGDRLAARGTSVDVAAWRRQSWFHQLARLIDEVAAIVPSGASWILVDGEMTGLRHSGRWNVIGFLERDGTYLGPPSGDEEAIAEVERRRAGGAQRIVFTWLCGWWRDVYPRLFEHLVTRYQCVLETDLAVAFDLTQPVVRASRRAEVAVPALGTTR